jgi:hypothetical protein
MAKNSSFSNRFPHFKKFLLVALVLTLGLTVYSVQNISTNTKQEAQTLPQKTCAAIKGYCVKFARECDPGYTGPYTCTAGEVCCRPRLNTAPGSLSSSQISCRRGDLLDYPVVKFSWGSISSAMKYRVHVWGTTDTGLKVNEDWITTTRTTLTLPNSTHDLTIPSRGRLYWQVQTVNDYAKPSTRGPYSPAKRVALNCR